MNYVNIVNNSQEVNCPYLFSSILLGAAAGNNGDGNLSTDDVLYPAKFDSVVAVSAIDYNNIAPVWSADSAKIELAAPGVDIYSTWLDGGMLIKAVLRWRRRLSAV